MLNYQRVYPIYPHISRPVQQPCRQQSCHGRFAEAGQHRKAQDLKKTHENWSCSWENHGKIMGKSGENHGKIRGKSWENHGKTLRTSPNFRKKRSWEPWENHGKILRSDWRSSWENHRKTHPRIVCFGNSSLNGGIWQLAMSDYQRVNGQWMSMVCLFP